MEKHYHNLLTDEQIDKITATITDGEAYVILINGKLYRSPYSNFGNHYTSVFTSVEQARTEIKRNIRWHIKSKVFETLVPGKSRWQDPLWKSKEIKFANRDFIAAINRKYDIKIVPVSAITIMVDPLTQTYDL
jgi:hypothetical protein